MKISLIVAYAANGVIGKQNDLPWYLPADLKRFKQLTTGHPVIMGRKTFDSIIARLGHPLPNRLNIVLTSDRNYDAQGAVVADSLKHALAQAEHHDEVFVIGGSRVFKDVLPFADCIYATEVKEEVEGDVFFPPFDKSEWQELTREKHKADDKNQYNFDFVTYQRIK